MLAETFFGQALGQRHDLPGYPVEGLGLEKAWMSWSLLHAWLPNLEGPAPEKICRIDRVDGTAEQFTRRKILRLSASRKAHHKGFGSTSQD